MNTAIHPTATATDSAEQCGLYPDPNGFGHEAKKSPFRKRIIKLVSPSSYFDTFILAAIFLNTIAIACVDYRYIDENYQPSAELSVRNSVIEKAEIIFTTIFTAECILKVVAYGFVRGKRAYLRDGWNILDFVIVIVSILGLIPGVPNFSVLRSFRVLRPLRSVSKLPSLRKIASAFIKSIGDLANVMVLLLFILACFTLFGVTFWRGLFHFRCRLTPFPVKMPVDCSNATDTCWDQFLLDAVSDPDAHRCLPFPNNDDEAWTQSSSPWFLSGSQDCIWPIDKADLRVCSESTGPGSYTCSRPATFMDVDISRTCGSNYDGFGNPRFIDSLEPYGFPRMQDSVFNEAFNWGFTNFDSFLFAFVTTFQIVSLEGWSDIMARVIDAWSEAPAIIAFTLLIVLGGIIALNIVLAVISSSLDNIEQELAQEEEATSVTSDTKKENVHKHSALRRKSLDIVRSILRLKDSAFRRKIREIIESRVYTRGMLAIILFNTIILSCDHYGISDGTQAVLDTGNYITTAIFFMDMVICNIGYGGVAYWSTSSTCFDGIIAISSVLELVLTRMAGSGGSGKSVMSVFRSLRLVRLFKMVKQWKSLHSLLNTMAQAASDVQSFGILLSLFVFIYSLIGMQLFSNRLHFDEVTGAHIGISDPKWASSDTPRSNFDDFLWSVTTVFQILSGEDWNVVMYDCWKATSVAPAYFISLVVLGVFCALNLFLAILLSPFDGSDLIMSNRIYPEGEPLVEEEQSWSICLKVADALHWMKDRLLSPISSRRCEFVIQKYHRFQMGCESFVAERRFDLCLTAAIVMSSITLALDDPLRNPRATMSIALLVLNYIFTSVFLVEFLIKLIASGTTKYFQDRWNWVDFTAVVSSVLELSNVKGGKTLRVLRAFRVLRPIKMINRFPEVKVVVDALLMSLPSVVDVGVVCALFFLVFSIFGVTFLKGTFYKCLESALTPEELNLVTYPRLVGELTDTELSWLNVDCGASTWDVGKLPTSRELCTCLSGEWVETIPQNFNNAVRGVALLFEISTTESWVNVMYAAIDQRGIDMQPVRDNNRLWALFFVVFLVLGAFFILELFVGVIIENFSRLREIKGHGVMTESQRQWASTQQFVMRIKPEILLRRPETKLRALCYDFIMPGTNPWFDRFIVAVIFANSISIATVSFGDSDEKLMVLGIVNWICSCIFVVEAALKLVGLGKMGYFRSRWNIFDFAVVCGLIIGFILKMSISDQRLAASISSLVSLIRMGRLIRLIRLVKQLRAPFNTMLSVLPGMINIGALLMLLIFVYAVCGVQLYGTVAFLGEMDEQANFRSFGNAMLLLLRFATGESWPTFMYGMMEERELCNPNPEYDEASPWCKHEKDYPNCSEVNGCSAGASVFIYFYSFTIIVSFIILNMFVAVVLQAFEASSEGELLDTADLEHFVNVWSQFDPEATWFMDASDVQSFLARLRPPLGMGEQSNKGNGDLYMKDDTLLEISVNDKKQVNIVNVASLLAKRLAKEKQGDAFGELSDDHPIQSRLAKKSSIDGEKTTTLGDMYSREAGIILRAVVRFKKRRRLAKQSGCHSGVDIA
ncbi:hypothetical protein ACHAXR_012558 [Thalassiosira sp. AJA248-18]